jgi:hypothetical protein
MIHDYVCRDEAILRCGIHPELRKQAGEIARLAEQHLKLVKKAERTKAISRLLDIASLIATGGEAYIVKKLGQMAAKMLGGALDVAAAMEGLESDERANDADGVAKLLRELERKYRKH